MSCTLTSPTLTQLGDGVYICNHTSLQTLADKNDDGKKGRNAGAEEVSESTTSANQQDLVVPSTNNTPSPTIVLMFTWMGAKAPHILKYVQAYHNLYPSATQIIVRSEASFFWSSDKAKKAYLRPVVQALELLGYLPPTNRSSSVKSLLPTVRAANIQRRVDSATLRVLVHAFSNGGSWQLTTLSAMLSQSYPHASLTTRSSAVILDSCPGNGGASKTVAAFSTAIRSPVLRAIVALAIRILFLYLAAHQRAQTLFYTLRVFFRRLPLFSSAKDTEIAPQQPPQTMIDVMKMTLSSPTLLPGFTAATPRMYMYSPADDIIPDDEVEAHAAEAESRGLSVRMEKFRASGHVAHARVYPERYWAAVAEFWAQQSAVDVGVKMGEVKEVLTS